MITQYKNKLLSYLFYLMCILFHKIGLVISVVGFSVYYIEKSFKVSVLKVRTMNVRGNKKRLGRYEGRKSNWKKAIISLSKDETIEFFEGA